VARPALLSYRFGYDNDGRLNDVLYPDGSRDRLRHDRHGNVTRATNRNNATTEFIRDEHGRLQATVDPLGRKTEFQVDASGAFEAVRFPDGTSEQFAWHQEENAATHTLRDGTDVVHLLTAEGTLAGAVWPDSVLAVELDERHHPTAVMTEDSTIEFSCDSAGNVQTESAGTDVRFEHDADGRLVSVATLFGRVKYEYDDNGYLAAIVDWDGRRSHIKSGYNGQLLEIRYANGIVERRTQGRVGVCDAVRVEGAHGDVVCKQRYEWDICERLVAWEDSSSSSPRRGVRLTYDSEGHLLGEQDPWNGRQLGSYHYDAAGNLIDDNGRSIVFGAMDEPLRVGSASIKYDGLGHMTRLPGHIGDITCEFDVTGRLRRTRHASTLVTYEYDALGRRISKTDGTATWRYGWAGVQLLWEEYQHHPAASPVHRDYLFLPDGVVPFAFREDGRTYYLQTDVRGAVIRAFDESGGAVWHASYDAFGNAEIDVHKIRQPLRLAGHYFDDETGLHYNGVRYYSPRIKSYLSRDPNWSQPGAANYSYARNDPWNRVDPHGTIAPLLAVGLLVVAGAAIGAVVGFALAKAMGTDPVAGAIGGAVGGAGTFFGPLAGAVTGFLGGVTESLVSQYRAGGPVCVPCALGEGVLGAVAGAALSGAFSLLGKALRPIAGPLARRIGTAIATKASAAGRAISTWTRTVAKPALRQAVGRLKGIWKKQTGRIKKWAARQITRWKHPNGVIHDGQQGKHIPGHNNFKPGRSELTHRDPQSLLDKSGGTGVRHGTKEVVDFKEPIGNWVSSDGKNRLPTSRGTIHYDDAGGAHIVPAHPTGGAP
jgi:RHS repeat-associated protein